MKRLFLIALLVACTPIAPLQVTPGAQTVPGKLVLEFDDGVDSHVNAHAILQAHGAVGSFAFVAGRFDHPGTLTTAQATAIVNDGHEIQDHTLYHVPGFWGDVANQGEWSARTDTSLAILASIGATNIRFWNEPGGTGADFSPTLRAFLATRYDGAGGRVAGASNTLTIEDKRNLHPCFIADPFNFGRAIDSWGFNGGTSVADEINKVKRAIASGVAMRLTVTLVFHHTRVADSTAFALTELLEWAQAKQIPITTLGEAYDANLQPTDGDFTPNPEFAFDLNEDGQADGWVDATFTGPNTVAINQTRVEAYGPCTQRVTISFDAKRDSLNTWRLGFTVDAITLVDGQWGTQRAFYEKLYWNSTWQRWSRAIDLPQNTDRLRVFFSGQGELRNVTMVPTQHSHGKEPKEE